MGAVRRLKGLDAIRDAVLRDTAASRSAVPHVLVLDGIPRTGLTVGELSRITGMPTKRIYTEIQRGRIRVIDGGRNYVIPVSELAEIEGWAQYVNST